MNNSLTTILSIICSCLISCSTICLSKCENLHNVNNELPVVEIQNNN